MVGWAANCSLAYDKIVVEYISEAVVRNNNSGGVNCRELGLHAVQ